VRSTAWTAGIADGVRRAFAPTRQVWLAGLGGTALAMRGARELWTRLVAEGSTTESWLRGTVLRRSASGG
jgi:hypothetical protein